MKNITTQNAPQAIGPYSQAIISNGFLFASGQIALKPDGEFVNGDIKEQTMQIMKNIAGILNEAGLNYDNIVKTTIFLTDMGDFKSVNEIYGRYFIENMPARSTVCVKELPKNALVEIEITAELK